MATVRCCILQYEHLLSHILLMATQTKSADAGSLNTILRRTKDSQSATLQINLNFLSRIFWALRSNLHLQLNSNPAILALLHPPSRNTEVHHLKVTDLW